MQEYQSSNPENKRPKRGFQPKEFKIVALRECSVPESLLRCQTAEDAAAYWNLHIKTHPHFNPEIECLAVLLLNSRTRIRGHQLIATGIHNSVLVSPREVFRAAIIGAAAELVVMHNHPSGDPSPSDADLQITRELVRAGQILKIPVCDHVIVGNPRHASLRELGCLIG